MNEKYTLEDIAGYEREKEEVSKIVDLFNDFTKYQEKGAYIPKGLMLYGEPGNGKTLFAKVISSLIEAEFHVFDHNADNQISELRALFKKAKSAERAIVFIDELDKIIPLEDETPTDNKQRMLNMILSFVDGYKTTSNNGVLFIAAANSYDSMPDSLVRPGRMDKKISLKYPTLSDRKAILEHYIAKTNVRFDIDTQRLAQLTNGQSCAGLRTIVNEAIIDNINQTVIDESGIQKIINDINNETIASFTNAFDLRVRAIAELGGFIIARAYNDGDYIININSRSESSGSIFLNNLTEQIDDYSDDDDDDDDYWNYGEEDGAVDEILNDSVSKEIVNRTIFTKKEYEIIMQLELAKIIANVKFNDGPYDTSRGVLKKVESTASAYLLSGFLGLEYIFPMGQYDTLVSEQYRQTIETAKLKLIRDNYEKAETLVLEYQAVINEFLTPLLLKKVLAKSEIGDIVDKIFKKEVSKE